MTVRRSSIMVAILIMPWFNFAVGVKWPLIGILINMIRVIEILWAAVCLITNRRMFHRLYITNYLVPLSVLYGVLTVSTIINGGKLENALQLALYGFWPFVVLALSNSEKKPKETFLEGIVIAFSILVVINLFLMIAYPQGIYTTYTSGTVSKYYLFGAKNQMVAPLITALVFFVEYSFRKNDRLTCATIVMCGMCVVEIAAGGSGTGIIMVILFVALCLYQIWKKKSINATVTLFVVLALTAGFVVLRVQNWFDFIIVSVLHKSLTLSNRVYIWEAAIDIIKSHPLIGTGVSETLAGDVLLTLSYLSRNTFAHNMFLDYLVMGGILTFGGFIMNLFVSKKQFEGSVAVCKYGKSFVWGGVILYLTASIVEIYTGNYCLFMMMAYIASLPKHKVT